MSGRRCHELEVILKAELETARVPNYAGSVPEVLVRIGRSAGADEGNGLFEAAEVVGVEDVEHITGDSQPSPTEAREVLPQTQVHVGELVAPLEADEVA
jgi:hypothetical protein